MSYLDVNNITADVTDAQLQASYDAHVNTLKGLLPELIRYAEWDFNEEAARAASAVCEDLQKVLDAIARRWLSLGYHRQDFATDVLKDMVRAQETAFSRASHLEVG